MAIVKNIDIILDTFYFGIGNTFNKVMNFIFPVQTMSANQERGRVFFANYKQMDIKNPPEANSPEEYI